MKTVREVLALEVTAQDFPDSADLVRSLEPCAPALKWADSILSALKEAGYQVVPVEPTEGMIAEGSNAAFRAIMIEGPDGPHPNEDCFDVRALYTWKAMVAASLADANVYPV